jgi:CRP/FNR family cyclic AMP-dependent transcriptional regulator
MTLVPDDLRRFSTFSHFTADQLNQLDGCAERRVFPAGTKVFLEGQTAQEIYLLQSGEARVRVQTPFGPFDLAALDPGDLFGEQSFLSGGFRSSTVEVVKDLDSLLLEPASLRAIADMDASFKQALYWTFWKSLSRKLRGANRRLLDFFESEEAEAARDAPAEPAGSEKMDLASKRKVLQEKPLSEMEINFLASLSREERFPPGKLIFRQGEPGDRMYVVVEGQVLISTVVPSAGEEALFFVERGDYFGEMALIDDEPRSADARAHPDEGALVLSITKEVLSGILSVEKVSSVRLLQTLCSMVSARLRQIDEKLIGWYLVAGADPQVRSQIIRS